jgi:hypothetical protein
MQFSERNNTTRWIIILFPFNNFTDSLEHLYLFSNIQNEERLKMNLWAKAQKTLINAGENTDVELPFKFSATLQYPLSLPRNSIINTVTSMKTL